MKSFVASTIVFAVLLSAAHAAKPKRAKLPKWDKFPSNIFFKDAFKEALVGKRPTTLGGRPKNPSSTQKPNPTESNDSVYSWSELASAQTLEDEVKALQIAVQKSVTTPGRFSGGGYQDVRRQYTELATLFAVIADYDAKVRWKKEAPLARDYFARAAANAKVTSIQAFNDAKLRKQDLEELVRGGTLTSTKAVTKKNDWSNICDRGPLMERFTGCYDEGLMVWTTQSEFKKNKLNIKREAELLRLFAVVLTQEGMEDAGDEDYEAYCKQLGTAADKVLQAVQNDDATAAREATSAVGKSCAACHEDYRG